MWRSLHEGVCEESETVTVIHRKQENEDGTVSITDSSTNHGQTPGDTYCDMEKKGEVVDGGAEECTDTIKKKRTHRGPRRPRQRKIDTDVFDEDKIRGISANWRVSSALKPESDHLDSCGQHQRGITELRHSSSTLDLQDPFLGHGRDAVGISPASCLSSPASEPSQSPEWSKRENHLTRPLEVEHTQELERRLEIHSILLTRVNALPVWDGSDIVFKALHEYLGRCEKSLHALQLPSPPLEAAFSVLEIEANESLFEACTDSLALLAVKVLEIEIQFGDERSEVEDGRTVAQEVALSRAYAIVEKRGLASPKDRKIRCKQTERADGHDTRSL